MQDFLDVLKENDSIKTSEGKEFVIVAKRGVSVLGYNNDGFEFWDSYNTPSDKASGQIIERLIPMENCPDVAHEFNDDGSEFFTIGGDTALWDTQDGWVISKSESPESESPESKPPKKKVKASTAGYVVV